VAPSRLLELAGGPMGTEALTSIRAEPAALEQAGYRFVDRDVRDVVASALQD
jgi:NAD dependent epimerase/dehydratase family enzyme